MYKVFENRIIPLSKQRWRNLFINIKVSSVYCLLKYLAHRFIVITIKKCNTTVWYRVTLYDVCDLIILGRVLLCKFELILNQLRKFEFVMLKLQDDHNHFRYIL